MNGPDECREWTEQTPRASSSLGHRVLTQPPSDWKAHPSLASPRFTPACSSLHHRTSVPVVLAKGKPKPRELQEKQSWSPGGEAAGTGWKQSVRCADGTVWTRFLSG